MTNIEKKDPVATILRVFVCVIISPIIFIICLCKYNFFIALTSIVLILILYKIISYFNKGNLTIIECLFPFLLSIPAAIIGIPFELIAGNLFSVASCIMSGLFLTIGLVFYRFKLISGMYLVLPFITFIYEALPISLPTDLDNLISFSASAASIGIGKMIFKTQVKNILLDTNENKNKQLDES